MAKVIQLRKSDCYQLKISLNNVKPLIWRRFLVDSNIKLPDLLKVISDTENEGYDEMIEWLGDDFDPEDIDIEEINEMLKEQDFGCIFFD